MRLEPVYLKATGPACMLEKMYLRLVPMYLERHQLNYSTFISNESSKPKSMKGSTPLSSKDMSILSLD